MKKEGLAMQTADRVAPGGAASVTRMETRRTGLAFLSLIVATNFVPWMQLAEASIDSSQPPSPAESSLVIASCLLAAGLVTAAWLCGRRLPVTPGRSALDPRDAGLLLAVLAALANLALAAILHRRAGGSSFGGELKWFGPVWYGVVLPTEIGAAFFKGRASIPAPKVLAHAASPQ
jgi:hypothetical protein